MRDALRISDVRLTPAPPASRRAGLLGWIACRLNGALEFDGLVLRRLRSGELGVSFPARSDTSGGRHFSVRPVNDSARREIERQILRELKGRLAS